MSDFSNFTGKFRARKDTSQQSTATKVTKRQRESLVCNQCRRSKLRCDRGRPCSSCVERFDGDACSYQRIPTTETRIDRNRQVTLEDRLAHLESLLKNVMSKQELPPYNDGSIPREFPSYPGGVDTETQNGKADTTRYVGSTHWSAILDDIEELKAVLGGHDAQQAEKSAVMEHLALGGELIFGSPNSYSLKRIISRSLPPRFVTDRYLSRYFQGEAFIVPFIHTYQFQRQYQEFWADTASVNPLWLSILFSTCCLVSLVRKANDSGHSQQNDLVSESSQLHAAAGQCLVIGQYYRPQKYAPEALTIYAQCKNIECLDPSREAAAILGMSIRLAYDMGYHRDPDSFGSLTVFEGEMRRRFWASCRQMDVMPSFQLGLPTNICLENCDIKSPRHVLDSDFDVDTEVLPVGRSENEPSKLLWFIVKDRQMVSFSKVCKDALSFREKSEAEVLQLDEEVRRMYATTPDVLRPRLLSDSIMDAPFLIINRLYVEFIYLKSLCVLHRRYMVRGNIFSGEVCIKSGMRLASHFIGMYQEFSPGGRLHSERWMLTNFIMNDFLLCIMVLCLAVHIRRKHVSRQSAFSPDMESETLPLLKDSYDICVEKSRDSKDARRVSHAIRFILENDAKTAESRLGREGVSRPDLASLSLQDENGYGASGNRTLFDPFDLLDPFGFKGNDYENVDWTVFEPPVSG